MVRETQSTQRSFSVSESTSYFLKGVESRLASLVAKVNQLALSLLASISSFSRSSSKDGAEAPATCALTKVTEAELVQALESLADLDKEITNPETNNDEALSEDEVIRFMATQSAKKTIKAIEAEGEASRKKK
jgi:hypothetical protein